MSPVIQNSDVFPGFAFCYITNDEVDDFRSEEDRLDLHKKRTMLTLYSKHVHKMDGDYWIHTCLTSDMVIEDFYLNNATVVIVSQ